MSGDLERRYRRVLHLLPGYYREVGSFPASAHAGLIRLTVTGGIMVWLGGPRRRRGGRGIYLHDPPPGYRRPRMPSKERQREARQDWELMRVATVVLVLAAAAFMVIIFLIIATRT